MTQSPADVDPRQLRDLAIKVIKDAGGMPRQLPPMRTKIGKAEPRIEDFKTVVVDLFTASSPLDFTLSREPSPKGVDLIATALGETYLIEIKEHFGKDVADLTVTQLNRVEKELLVQGGPTVVRKLIVVPEGTYSGNILNGVAIFRVNRETRELTNFLGLKEEFPLWCWKR